MPEKEEEKGEEGGTSCYFIIVSKLQKLKKQDMAKKRQRNKGDTKLLI